MTGLSKQYEETDTHTGLGVWGNRNTHWASVEKQKHTQG